MCINIMGYLGIELCDFGAKGQGHLQSLTPSISAIIGNY